MKKIILIAAMALIAISASAQRIGIVNYEELCTLMPEYMDAQRTILAVSKETSDTFQEMVNEFQNKSNIFEQKKSSWTASVLEAKQKELADMQQRIQEFQQTAYQELQEKQAQLLAPIREKALEAVRNLAKEQGILIVFDSSQIIYFDAENTVDLMPMARIALGIPEDRTLETVQEEFSALQLQYAN